LKDDNFLNLEIIMSTTFLIADLLCRRLTGKCLPNNVLCHIEYCWMVQSPKMHKPRLTEYPSFDNECILYRTRSARV